MNTQKKILTTAIAILAAFTASAQQSTATKETVKLRIGSNPDKVDFELRAYRPTDSELLAVGFREGWFAAAPFGPGNQANPNPSPKLTDFDKLQDTIAVVVRWKVKGGQDLASDGIGPHLRGVARVPNRFETSLSKGNYKAVATQLEGLGLLVATKISTGEFTGAVVQTDGLARFLWFVPADTKSVELILPPYKTITVTRSN